MNQPSQPMPEGWQEEMERIRDLIANAPIDALGEATVDNVSTWPIRDEVVYRITKLLGDASKENRNECTSPEI